MTEREVVRCSLGPSCGGSEENLASPFPYGPDHHGWDCPLSDPMGDVLRMIPEATGNPIIDKYRQHLLDRYLPIDDDPEIPPTASTTGL